MASCAAAAVGDNADSELTLAEFLDRSSSRQIGIKLDFKTDEAIRGSVDVLSQYQRKRTAMATPNPVWMNADIVGRLSMVVLFVSLPVCL